MCGICGIVHTSPSATVDERRLIAVRDVIAHRGPDGSRVRCGGGVGLGHRRLSIIDVEGGAQPLANETGTIWVMPIVITPHPFRTRSQSGPTADCGS